jgi:hypothetical protein
LLVINPSASPNTIHRISNIRALQTGGHKEFEP